MVKVKCPSCGGEKYEAILCRRALPCSVCNGMGVIEVEEDELKEFKAEDYAPGKITSNKTKNPAEH